MSRRFIGKKSSIKIIIISAIIMGVVGYNPKGNAGIISSVYHRVKTTANAFKDGVQLEDFRPLVSELLYKISPEAWKEFENQTGINVRGIILSGIFEQRIDLIAEIALAQDWVKNRALSDGAIAKMEEQSNSIGENLEKTVNLSEQVQETKVTQEILKKIAIQESLGAEREAVLIQQNQLEEVDRAISNQLSSRILEELFSTNIAGKREKIAEAISARNNSILISLPGSYSLIQNKRKSSDNALTVNEPFIKDLLQKYGSTSH